VRWLEAIGALGLIGASVISSVADAWPAPGAPDQVAVAKLFSERVLRGDYIHARELLTPDVRTTVLLRNPLNHQFVPGRSGTGYADLVRITDGLLKEVGKPRSISCAAKPIVGCRFDYGDAKRVIAPAFQFRGGKITTVDFIYITPEKLRELSRNG